MNNEFLNFMNANLLEKKRKTQKKKIYQIYTYYSNVTWKINKLNILTVNTSLNRALTGLLSAKCINKKKPKQLHQFYH